jgi:uncharacterized membrane protein YdjX (TVP38/TMEM64 family)
VRLIALGVLAATLIAGQLVRDWLGLDGFSAAGVRAAIADLGWYGPVLFFALVIFRQFLAMPSWLLLPAGGLCFGALAGTVLGAAGLVVSGSLKFWVARWLGRDWARARLGEHYRRLDERVDRLGPVLIGLSTAHPMGVLAPFHWGAGLSSLSFAPFVLALVLGAPIRCFALSTLGSSLADEPTVAQWALGGALFLAMLLPLAIPSVRRRLFASPPPA